MSDLTPSALAALAKQHLSLPPSTPDSRVPKFYTDELRRHLSQCPEEQHFRVTFQPKHGLGTVTCLKEGCNATITLLRRVRVKDGGKKDGFGSLSAYREHLFSHNATQIPVKSEPSEPSIHAEAILKPVNTANVGSSTDKRVPAPSSSTTTRFFATHLKQEENNKPSVSVTRVKPEPLEAPIPRKRLSDVAFGSEASTSTDKTTAGAVDQKRLKRAKTEERPTNEPLAPVTNAPIASGSRHTSDMNHIVPTDECDPQVMLDNVRIAMHGQQTMLNRILHLPTLDDFHFTLIDRYDKELQRLRALEQENLDRIAASTMFAGPTSPQYQDYYNMSLDATYENHPQAPTMPGTFPVAMQPAMPPIFNDQYAAMGNTPRLTVKQETAVENTFPAEHAPVASGSGMRYYSEPPAPDVKPIVDVQMASPYNSDDEDNADDGEYDYAALGLGGQFIDQIGIRIPAPINDDAHDDNGDFHGRGRDLFVGPQAEAGDLEDFLLEAGNAETFDGNESVEKALKYLGLNSLHHKLPGMEIVLMPHQVMGVAWMIEKERTPLKGGCLADEMGLGKTVQMIATLVHNVSDDPALKTNLIIAPLALLDQWKEEIETKSSYELKCMIYHGPNKTRRKSDLLKHDVVLTTFQTMANEWPDYENEMKKKAKAKKKGDDFIVDDSDAEDMKNHGYRANKRKQQAGLLFQTEFYRVIADEGQNIRNKRTRMSRAITDLNAVYRWCLTGTPIVNSLADVYGLIRFLKIRPWYDWAHFHSKIGILEKKNPGLAVARLQKLMATFLLRRKKNSKLDGKNLIELPEKKVELVKLEFSEEEREIYNMVEARSQARFNRYLRAGTVLKNYHQVLVLLLRLRQICSHPSLIQEDGVRFVSAEEARVKPEFATELTRARRIVSEEFVTKLKAKFLQIALERMEAEKKSANATIDEEECPICYDPMTEAVVTPCGHLFCRECIVDAINRPNVEGGPSCPVCRGPITENHLFSREAFEPSDKELDPSAESEVEDEEEDDESDFEVYIAKGGDKGKGKATSRPRRSTRRIIPLSDDEGEDSGADDDDDDMSDFIVESDEDEEEKDARRDLKKRLGKKRANIILDSDDEPETPEEKEMIFGARKKHEVVSKEEIKLLPRFLPSTKMKYMMDQLQKRAKSHPEEKTLLVSQWTGCLSLISDYLTEKGIPHVKYQGDMSRTKRDQAVQIFMSREKARVMLMSLKCGGVGLNLTRANNVISLDLGWSQAVESQAFDRVHRVGQQRDVLVQRVVIADTVEDRILKMQERKQTLADGSLGEGEGKKIGKLSVRELANLFGLDAQGRRL